MSESGTCANAKMPSTIGFRQALILLRGTLALEVGQTMKHTFKAQYSLTHRGQTQDQEESGLPPQQSCSDTVGPANNHDRTFPLFLRAEWVVTTVPIVAPKPFSGGFLPDIGRKTKPA